MLDHETHEPAPHTTKPAAVNPNFVDHSPEDAVQVVDSVGALRHVFISFGGPPRAMGNSLTAVAQKAELILRKLLSRARQRAVLVTKFS